MHIYPPLPRRLNPKYATTVVGLETFETVTLHARKFIYRAVTKKILISHKRVFSFCAQCALWAAFLSAHSVHWKCLNLYYFRYRNSLSVRSVTRACPAVRFRPPWFWVHKITVITKQIFLFKSSFSFQRNANDNNNIKQSINLLSKIC